MSISLSVQEIKHLINDIWYRKFRPVASGLLVAAAYLAHKLAQQKLATQCAMASLRFNLNSQAIKLTGADDPNNAELYLSLTTKGITTREAAARSIVLQWPNITEEEIKKGVIVITFTGVAAYFLKELQLKSFEKYFNLVLEPSWAGYADPDILAFCFSENLAIVQCSEISDRAFINCYPNKLVATSFGASDWVNHHEFVPQDLDKIYDSIYIANANPIKRVTRYIHAVRNIVNAGHGNYRGCLVCASWGGEKESILKLLQKYNLSKNLEVKFSLSKKDVIQHLNLSKTNILLSYKEGSNRSLFEAMFCDVPVIALQENIGINKAYINEHTGLLVPDGQLEQALIWMASNNTGFKPRQWALKNISPEATTEKLAEVLRLRLGQSHINATSLQVKTNNPEVEYFHHPGMAFHDLNEQLLQLFTGKKVDEQQINVKIAEIENTMRQRMDVQRLN